MLIENLQQKIKYLYATCHSYQDVGWVDEVGRDNEIDNASIRFATWFIRPNLFRFDWVTQHPYSSKKRHSSLWSDGKNSYILLSDKLQKISNLQLELKKCIGISRVTCFYIPWLLLKLEKNCFDKESFITLVDEYYFNEEPCYKLLTNSTIEPTTNITVSKKQPIIRQIVNSKIIELPNDIPEPMLTRVKNDLLKGGANVDAMMLPFTYKCTYTFDQVSINHSISPDIFSGKV